MKASDIPREARFALALLFVINFLNYIDRQIVFAVQVLIQKDFNLTDTQCGMLGSSFMIVYMLASPVTGVLADRFPRHWFIAAGVGLWSVATAGAGFARDFWHMLAARAAVGIGEAGYATVSPSLLSDLFPRDVRGRIMSIFYMATPVGSALGIVIGGFLGQHFGWRVAFMAVGLPGLFAAWAALSLPDPPRGAMDDEPAPTRKPAMSDYLALLKIPSYLINTAGMTAYTFSMGGLIAWMPTFFVRERHMPLDQATLYFGLVSVAAGILGTTTGGFLGDRLQQRTPKAYFLLSGIGLGLGVPFAIAAVLVETPALCWTMLFVAEFFLFLNTGPLNAALANVVPASMRATAFAMNIFIIHLLGDVASPPLIGFISDQTNLTVAVIAAALPMGLGSAIYLRGMGHYGPDVERAAGMRTIPAPVS